MKVTSKGRVTIPRDIRQRTGMTPGCEVEFVLEGDRVILKKAYPRGRGGELVESMTGKGDVRMTTDEIMALTRGIE